jgi:hypothetical protein
MHDVLSDFHRIPLGRRVLLAVCALPVASVFIVGALILFMGLITIIEQLAKSLSPSAGLAAVVILLFLLVRKR